MRAISLHRDVIVVTSAILRVNCVIVRGAPGEGAGAAQGPQQAAGMAKAGQQDAESAPGGQPAAESAPAAQQAGASEPHSGESEQQTGESEHQTGETFVIDSPVLPDELDALPALVEQARFPAPSGLLVTHGDWDHLLGRLAFPGVALGAAESTAERLRAAPGEAQRDLRAFDEELMIAREQPLALGSVQALPVPGRCAVGDRELELYAAAGHTPDGMAILIPWALVLVAGDYLSAIELPTLSEGGDLQAYLATLERLRALVAHAEHVVPGHGPVLDGDRALGVLEEDATYLQALAERGASAELPDGRRSATQRELHRQNVAKL